METLKITKIREVKTPTRGTSVAAGIDFFVPTNLTYDDINEKVQNVTHSSILIDHGENGIVSKITLPPGESVLIPSGIKMKIPNGYALIFFNKSGVGSKKQLDVLASVVDEDYEGEVHINLVNNGNKIQEINAGDKIVQGVLLPINYAPVEEIATVDELYANSNSARGTGGFGSTGN